MKSKDAATSWLPINGRVALIAPASAIDPEVLETTLAQLDILGVDYWLGNHVSARYRYLAGTIEERLQDLHAAFETPGISAVWCLRGGYGCGQLISGIDWQKLQAATARPLIGYSDISILLSAFHRRALPAIHGPVAASLALQPLCPPTEQHNRLASNASLSRLLSGKSIGLPSHHLCGSQDRVEGYLIGGNLTALASMAGTEGALYVPQQSILILEDVNESAYRLERSLWQLLNSIDQHRLRAICLGEFIDCPCQKDSHTLERIICDYVKPLGIPLYKNLPSGHGACNHAWPYGRLAWLEDNRLHWAAQ